MYRQVCLHVYLIGANTGNTLKEKRDKFENKSMSFCFRIADFVSNFLFKCLNLIDYTVNKDN